MSSEIKNILSSMITIVSELDGIHQKGIAVSQPSNLAPRSRLLEVFSEGESFSGMDSVGSAECCIAPTPAPHIPSSVPLKDYLDMASEVFGNKPFLHSKYQGVEHISPQVTLWWKRKYDDKPYDFADIYNLSDREKSDFCSVISNKSLQGVRFIMGLRGKPAIWGTWGHGTVEERMEEGLTRGGPTVKGGHLHITFFDDGEQELSFQKLSNKDKLNHYAPWNGLILESFGKPMCKLIKSHFSKHYTENNDVTVERINEIMTHSNESVSIRNGFIINFKDPVALENVMRGLVETAGKTEEMYQLIHNLLDDFYGHPNKENGLKEKMTAVLSEARFSNKEASDFAKFIFSIQPTYGQLLQKKRILAGDNSNDDSLSIINERINKYGRIREKINHRGNKNSLTVAMVEDTLKNPDDENITFTFCQVSLFLDRFL